MDKDKEEMIKILEGVDFSKLTQEQITGPNGLVKQLTKRLLEKAMNAEMTEHLGYEKHEIAEKRTANSRNGKSKKTVITEDGDVEIDVKL